MAQEINIFEEAVDAAAEAEDTSQEPFDPQWSEQGKRILEALLFASPSPLPFQKIREILETFYPFKAKGVLALIEDLKKEYAVQNRAFRLEEIAEGYLLRTSEQFHPYLQQLFQTKRKEKLSPAGLEALAIIAYKQPVTRLQIDAFRGVDSSGIVQALLDRQLIEAAGKLEVPGRPTLYKTTDEFLKHFGLKDLSELPTIER
jgi:segregation and condensation protein B